MFKFLSKKKSGFTLVEMLIVIVIIGLLAASLIPKLTGMQAKARDTVRRTDISSLGTAIYEFYVDNGTFPGVDNGGQSSNNISGDVAQYIKSLPKDPLNTRIFNGVKDDLGNKKAGYYMYAPVKKNGIPNASFVLMAGMEEVGGSVNRVFDAINNTFDGNEGGEIGTGADFLDLVELTCTRVRKDAANSFVNTGATPCTAKEKVDNLRYIYLD